MKQNSNTESIRQNFIFLSDLLNTPVRDSASRQRLGKTFDLVATLRENFPLVSGLIVKSGGRKFHIPWTAVKNVSPRTEITVENAQMQPENKLDWARQISLRDSFLDRQIVDISGAKVVRVNDLHLLMEQTSLWLVHMDIGFRGLLRRLGWLKTYSAMVRWLFSYDLKDRLISWKYVQPITSSDMSNNLQLTVGHSSLSELHPSDLSGILVDLGTDERKIVFNSLDDAMAADTLEQLPLKVRVTMAECLDPGRLARIIQQMPLDESVDLLANLPRKLSASLYKILPADMVGRIKELLLHSDNLAGSIMNTEFLVARPTSTASDVISLIRAEAAKPEFLHFIYITDDKGVLHGVITLRELLVADPAESVANFMRKRLVKVRPDTPVKEVARVFSKYNFDVVPVVDSQNRIIGIITMKDAFEAAYSQIRDKG